MTQLEIETNRYKVKDIWINVAQTGTGDPLVFVHGWNNSWIGWTRLAEKLAPHYRLHLLDLPGFGDSDPLNRYSIEILSRHVYKYVKRCAPDARALIGGSMGTFILADTLKEHSIDTKLILIGPVFTRNKIKFLSDIYKRVLALSSDRRHIQQVFEKFIRHRYSAYLVEKYLNAYEFNKELVDTYQVPGRKKARGKSYVQLGVSMMNYEIENALKAIDNKTLLILGASDKYTSMIVARETLAQINKPNISLEFVSHAGHSPSYEQPEKTADLILKFLE